MIFSNHDAETVRNSEVEVLQEKWGFRIEYLLRELLLCDLATVLVPHPCYLYFQKVTAREFPKEVISVLSIPNI